MKSNWLLLKTTINLALQVRHRCQRRDRSSGIGLAPIPRSQGFFAIAELAEQQTYQTSVRFESFMRKKDGRLVIGGFDFHGWRALYAFEGAPPVKGAMRVRAWNYNPHWLRFRWNPDLEAGDSIMPNVVYGEDGEPVIPSRS